MNVPGPSPGFVRWMHDALYRPLLDFIEDKELYHYLIYAVGHTGTNKKKLSAKQSLAISSVKVEKNSTYSMLLHN